MDSSCQSRTDFSSQSQVSSLDGTLAVRATKPLSSLVLDDIEKPENESATDLIGPLGLNLLHAPPEPLADFVFVHGLGGGSRKSWSKTDHPYHYWPKEWLPRDPDLKHVRIHTFGYASNWSDKNYSGLALRDFAHSLLGELMDSPDIKADDTRIVLIGHSMGGLVIKETCILANQDPLFNDLARRFHAMYFLATPHRGPDLPMLLTNIVRVFYGEDIFINNIQRNSSTILAMNDTFRHYSKDLQLWSFYESKKSRILTSDMLVVDKSSATLGYAHERIALLDDDHRGVSKFEKPSDPNFRTLRNAFCTMITDITTKLSSSKQVATQNDLRRLRALLSNTDSPIDDLLTLDDARTTGSCEWLISRDEFQKWRTSSSDAPPLLWLLGNPGSGKSILTSHVIHHLGGQNVQYSFFFFKHNMPQKLRVRDCLLSLAYQMCFSSPEARGKLLALEEDGYLLGEKDERIIWRAVFLNGIFQAKTLGVHYWVIDALDECAQAQLLLSMFSDIDSSKIPRIFITSRKTRDIERSFTEYGQKFAKIEMQITDTSRDIEQFVTSKICRLPIAENVVRQRLMPQVLTKAAGNFLWVRLVMGELENAWSIEAAESVLNMIPSDMDGFYTRILNNISKDQGSLKLARAIITWVTYAVRPLTMGELQHALKMDIHETVSDIRKCIASVCGQLLFVDRESRVQVIHKTAHDFLLREDLSSNLALRNGQGDLRLVFICLELLSGQQLWLPKAKNSKFIDTVTPTIELSLVSYAAIYFSDHLGKLETADISTVGALYKFFDNNVLNWIEHIAKTGDLSYITHAATNIKSYLSRRDNSFSETTPEPRLVEAWAKDLTRISTKFGKHLLTSPSSIHSLVAPLCPKRSIMAEQFDSPHRGLSIKGPKDLIWNEHLAQFQYHRNLATAVACGKRFLAVGLSSGHTMIYHAISYQLYRSQIGNERVTILAFSHDDELLALGSPNYVRVYNVHNGNQIHHYCTDDQVLDFKFTDESEFLWSVSQGNYVSIWGIQDGCKDTQILLSAPPPENLANSSYRRRSTISIISSDRRFVATYFRGQPIQVFNLNSESYYGCCLRNPSSVLPRSGVHCPVNHMMFNPEPKKRLIIAAYHDGELITYDLRTLKQKQSIPNIHAFSLACTLDGTTLAAGSGFGKIRIFVFGGDNGCHLNLVHEILANGENIKSLTFSSDGLRLIHIEKSRCYVWEPAVVVDKTKHDAPSQSYGRDPTLLLTTRSETSELKADITVVACHGNGDIVFCGKDDGSVTVFSTRKVAELRTLYRHQSRAAIRHLFWGENNSVLATADEAATVVLHKLCICQGQWMTAERIIDRRFPEPVHGLLMDSLTTRLLISGNNLIELWTHDGRMIRCRTVSCESERRPISTRHQLQPDIFVIFDGCFLHLYNWLDCTEASNHQIACITAITQPITQTSRQPIILDQGSDYIVELVRFISGVGVVHKGLDVWQTSNINADSNSVTALSGFAFLGPRIEHMIAVNDTRLFYLDTDLWVCTVDLQSFATTQQAKRHFFIPADWCRSPRTFLFHLTVKNEFVIVKGSEIVVVMRGLDFAETVSFGKRLED